MVTGVLGLFGLGALAAVAYAIFRAEDGYEDDGGWHR